MYTLQPFVTSVVTRLIPLVLLLLMFPGVISISSMKAAATLPLGFTESQIGGNLSNPTAMAFAPDGRLFVCQQNGQLRVIKAGALLTTPFLTVTVNSSGERGLLGVTFDPGFATNQFVYVYYTTSASPIHNRVSRFTANGDVAVAGSEVIILELNNLSAATNHNGGALHFGSDGKLYIAVGDNASSANSQTLNNLLGKILRINTDGTIPADNPFYNTATGNNRAIWALGLRNPFTFAIQPGFGRMFVNDVGESTWEEINDGIAGSNYGWPTCEGACASPNPNFRDPLYAYQHLSGACAVTGGAFYNPAVAQFPGQYTGKYFFAEYCAGWIRVFDPATGTASDFASGLTFPVDLRVGLDGSLYYLQRGASSNTGQVWRIEYTSSAAPNITQHPISISVSVGQPATFSVAASGATPHSYQWRRDGVDIPGANFASYTIPSTTLADSGARFRCTVSNSLGTATSNEATLTVTVNQPPVATISTPAEGTLYSGGQTISYSGTATDPETGSLPASAFTWEVNFHHDAHTHPAVPPTSGSKSGSFTVPQTGETSANVWYRIHLTVTDPAGLTHTVYRDILPRTSVITLQTNPANLQVTLDGQPVTTPVSVTSVVGVNRTLGVVSPQTVGSETYQFVSWSDGGAASHNITTPASNTTYTANFGVPGAGDGLSGTYYDNLDFTGATVTRIDPTINFSWGSTAPAPGFGTDTYNVRWTGQIQAQFSHLYLLHADQRRHPAVGQLPVDHQ